MMKFFYLPFLYTLETRLDSRKNQLAWFFTYLIPVYSITVWMLGDISFLNSYSVFLSISCIYTIYELGYIYNDSELIKWEKEPTLRLSVGALNYYDKYKIQIYTFRSLLLCLLLYLLKITGSNLLSSTFYSIFIIAILYIVYNSVRNRFSIVIYFFLVFFRYFGTVFLIVNPVFLLFFIFLYPFPKVIEFASKKKYNISFIHNYLKNHDYYRLIYYSLLIVITSIFNMLFGAHLMILSVVGYFWVYRVSVFILAKYLRK